MRYPQFNDVVEAELSEAGYKVMAEPSEQVDKVIQLYETMMTRHTTMVVGQTGKHTAISPTQGLCVSYMLPPLAYVKCTSLFGGRIKL